MEKQQATNHQCEKTYSHSNYCLKQPNAKIVGIVIEEAQHNLRANKVTLLLQKVAKVYMELGECHFESLEKQIPHEKEMILLANTRPFILIY